MTAGSLLRGHTVNAQCMLSVIVTSHPPLALLNTKLQKLPPHLYSTASAGLKTQESVVAGG